MCGELEMGSLEVLCIYLVICDRSIVHCMYWIAVFDCWSAIFMCAGMRHVDIFELLSFVDYAHI